MRTASMVLGIIGGALAVIFALMFIISGAFVSGVGNMLGDIADGDFQLQIDGQDVTFEGNVQSGNIIKQGAASAGFMLWGVGILSIVGAVLAFIGAAKVKKNNILAGVLILVAAVPNFFTGLGIIAAILLIIGGILALVPENKPSQAPQA